MEEPKQRNAKVIGELMRSDQLNIPLLPVKRKAKTAKPKKEKDTKKTFKGKKDFKKTKKREVTIIL